MHSDDISCMRVAHLINSCCNVAVAVGGEQRRRRGISRCLHVESRRFRFAARPKAIMTKQLRIVEQDERGLVSRQYVVDGDKLVDVSNKSQSS